MLFFCTTLYDCILFYGPIVPEINSSSYSSSIWKAKSRQTKAEMARPDERGPETKNYDD